MPELDLSAQTLLTASLGSAVGLVLGLSGAGGGALAVPLLVLALGWTVQQAAPVALTAVGLAALIGAAFALREGLLRWRAALVLAAAGIPAAPLGVWLAQRTPPQALLAIFVGFMLLTAWRMWRGQPGGDEARLPACIRPDGEIRLRWNRACAALMLRVGATAGLLGGLLGVGGGFVIVPALDRGSNLDLRSIQGTSMAVIGLVALASIASAAAHGRWHPLAAAPFAAGALAGLLAGRRLAAGLSPRVLRRAFALLCLGVAMLLALRSLRALL